MAEKTEEQTKQYIRSLLAEQMKPQRPNETEEEFSSRQQMIQQQLDVEADINPSLFLSVAQEDREPKADGGFPDLNKDGKVSYADVLKGRGAFAEGGVSEEINEFLDKKSPFSEKTIEEFKKEGKTKEDIRRLEIELFSLLAENNPLIRDFKKELKEEKRDKKAEGSMMVPPEMEMPVEEPPVDTYDNISPEEEMQQAEDMLPDDEMEEEYVDYVAEEVLEPEEQEYLFKVLDEDPKLEGI